MHGKQNDSHLITGNYKTPDLKYSWIYKAGDMAAPHIAHTLISKPHFSWAQE